MRLPSFEVGKYGKQLFLMVYYFWNADQHAWKLSNSNLSFFWVDKNQISRKKNTDNLLTMSLIYGYATVSFGVYLLEQILIQYSVNIKHVYFFKRSHHL